MRDWRRTLRLGFRLALKRKLQAPFLLSLPGRDNLINLCIASFT